MRRHSTTNAIGECSIATAFLVIAARAYVVRKSRDSRPGSVADLVRPGQLTSDRRGISYFCSAVQCLILEQKLKKLMIDPGNAKDFERPFRSQPG
ncbi:hypothetical protein RJ641_032622 [Dillenia turbinata]|uniref:Uncharacterized protein n=1 Tax=Dillenia turbinata TaxID=194707 RepID=A0AAN8VS60_9MAGN